MIFYKTQGSGNDFIHIDNEECSGELMHSGELVRRICRRNLGAGADGVVFYSVKKDSADFRIFNRDGREAELSGNGMAGCASVLFYEKKFKDRLTLNTAVGSRTLELLNIEDNKVRMKVEIGEPDFNDTGNFPELRDFSEPFTLSGIRCYPVSVGNPHIVIFIEESESSKKQLMQWAEELDRRDFFPNGVNMEFVVRGSFTPDSINNKCRVIFYERGAGFTESSSTGSSAVFAVMRKLRLCSDHLDILCSGGIIKASGSSNIFLENFTEIVYKGEYLG